MSRDTAEKERQVIEMEPNLKVGDDYRGVMLISEDRVMHRLTRFKKFEAWYRGREYVLIGTNHGGHPFRLLNLEKRRELRGVIERVYRQVDKGMKEIDLVEELAAYREEKRGKWRKKKNERD